VNNYFYKRIPRSLFVVYSCESFVPSVFQDKSLETPMYQGFQRVT
jgi:hypothetical protein